MKGNPEIITMLNERLAEEHSAIQQYSAHAAMCKNWGYEKLVSYLLKRAETEIEHSKELMDRILYVEGTPDVTKMGIIEIGETVSDIFLMDKEAELLAVAGYTEGIELSLSLKDYGTQTLLQHILSEEENHLSEIEQNVSQIMQAGIGPYLAMQIGG